jgi:hypothetical protein
VAVAAILVGTAVWIEAPALWPKPGPSVDLLGINRTLTYYGSQTGYVSGSVTSGCPLCPLLVTAGTTVLVNTTWLEMDPWGSHVNYTFVNVTIRSPFPFLSIGSNQSTYSSHSMDEAGGPGGGSAYPIYLDIPYDSSALPRSGTIYIWINATASTAPYPYSQ